MNEILVCNSCAKKNGYPPTDRTLDHQEICVVCGKLTADNFERDILSQIITEVSSHWKVIMENPPLISVMITVKDRIPSLRRALASWKLQDYPFQEYVLIDDGSRDRNGILKAVVDSNLPNCKIVRMESSNDRTPSKAWNEGFNHVNGDFVVCTGEDLVLSSPQLLTKMYRQYHGVRRISVITYFLNRIQTGMLDTIDYLNQPEEILRIPGVISDNATITAAGIHTYLSGQSIREWEWFGKFVNHEDYMSSDSNVFLREHVLERGCDTLVGAMAYHQWHVPPKVSTEVPAGREYSTKEAARLR